MPTTTYKGMSVPTTGTETDTWGDDLNANSFGVADRNLGGIVNKTLSNINVTLSATESQMAIVRLTGTLTGPVQVTTACQGFTYVENLTSGAFAVTFTNGVGTPVTVVQGSRSTIITDATNGPREMGGSIPSGSSTLFFNASAPSGWTKSVTHDNKAIRLVSGTGGATGGITGFTSVFASRTPVGTVGDTTLTTAQIPAHTHTYLQEPDFQAHPTGTGSSNARGNYTVSTPTGSAGGGGSHTHTWAGTAMDFAVQYVDAIICIKD